MGLLREGLGLLRPGHSPPNSCPRRLEEQDGEQQDWEPSLPALSEPPWRFSAPHAAAVLSSRELGVRVGVTGAWGPLLAEEGCGSYRRTISRGE